MRGEGDAQGLELLLPRPRKVRRAEGQLSLAAGGRIVVQGPASSRLVSAAEQLRDRLATVAGGEWGLAGEALPIEAGKTAVLLIHEPGRHPGPERYDLTVGPAGVRAAAGDPAGVFYGIQTLIQLVELFPHGLPFVAVDDWPDFPHRGMSLDVSRNRVPTMATLFGLVDMLARWKLNQLQLYTEHTFAYRNHPRVWAEASPMTGEEVRRLDAYCRERFIELVPNQNSFAHMRPWLIHEPYRRLAECPEGCDTAWGRFEEPFTLFPSDESFALIRSLYDELLPHFTSRQLNAGCDEPVDLGKGRSKAAVAERGLPAVYLEFVLRLYRDLKDRGVAMQMWGDMIGAHPELARELPRDLIVLEWGYEADHPFEEHCCSLNDAGIPYYVCPGTSSWNSIAGRTENAVANLRNAAESGLRKRASGYLIADWGDNGHWQPLPVSYLGTAYGAAMAWAVDANRGLDIAAALDAHAYRDRAGLLGKLTRDLGDVHQLTGIRVPNATSLFRILQTPVKDLAAWLRSQVGDGEADANRMRAVRGRIEEILDGLGRAQMCDPGADLIGREFAWAAAMLGHACDRASWALEASAASGDRARRQGLKAEADRLIEEFGALWRARSRPGGFKDSLARLEAMREDYM